MHLVQSMAFVGQQPWHGLGNKLAPKQPLQTWAKAAGMDWSIEEAEVRFVAGNKNLGSIHAFPEQKVLYRSDNKAPLSVVSARYQVVQPAEILEFYRDLTEHSGFELETAGVLKDGKKLWALARTGQSVTLKGKDTVNGYVLLATACDGTLATTAQHTSVRVVCNNTLQIALGDSAGTVKVGHRSQFDAQAVKRQLGIAVSSWDAFMVRMKALSERKMSDAAAEKFLRRVLTYPTTNPANRDVLAVNERAIKAVAELYSGRGKGADLAAASGTAWGLLNAVTEYVDHRRRARSDDHRRDAAWFGSGATLKDRAWDEALKLVL
ncbi:phage/plasmid-like TIGR03299 family protein [Burkholderia pseudomallei]|nr:phage/plasmid-like TIGR03299 family protein [Burkholderia pseudomallei]CAJ4257070.1 phage/plasmid-like TIGR03299 family protein [Burkholderia pseudomallei]CAJ4454456.1 phage/plasmid-like TIGR03299 family protein [Burkholderia pseudomallei]CAJ4765198.1 phage/plasmid-like TIGR03299 family protein [Burkholderia pseudomallei]CAJ7894341.1 phage/plasmid-like TIGR03299 family protein [Burkholderia pseudomallei]